VGLTGHGPYRPWVQLAPGSTGRGPNACRLLNETCYRNGLVMQVSTRCVACVERSIEVGDRPVWGGHPSLPSPLSPALSNSHPGEQSAEFSLRLGGRRQGATRSRAERTDESRRRPRARRVSPRLARASADTVCRRWASSGFSWRLLAEGAHYRRAGRREGRLPGDTAMSSGCGGLISAQLQ